ncbi:tRNAHis guanylyltransferase [Gymnopilus junonius]|uniref:tRNA(His) guanylyltransferase n=1 Tax=Gymnopilus junonius TaxID=109634 RepID=A0A9P5TNQ3_GYMJU|nr:tRNAHis guanylyltransferase [Gymnopilus junonius]
MANSKYTYVRDFELPDPLLPGTFMLFRLDGHSFHRFSDMHEFKKPNDIRALQLMDHAAKDVMTEYPDIVLAFGESDEFSFLLRKSTSLYNRRQSKIVSTLTSLFTSSYVFHWPEYFPNYPLKYPPSFDGRIVLYPTEKHVRDYFAWRQADTHINNLYNTTFWALIQGGDKHEILFSRFAINYNRLDARFRKGSVLFRTETTLTHYTTEAMPPESIPEATPTTGVVTPVSLESSKAKSKSKGSTEKSKQKQKQPQTKIEIIHCDIIQDDFWNERPWILDENWVG